MAYNVHVAARVAGISERQVRHWDQQGLLKPSVQQAAGRGSRRLYSFEDLVELRIIAGLRSSGVSLQRVGKVIRYLRKHVLALEGKLRGVRVLTDGASVFVRSDDRSGWQDALRAGQVMLFVPVDEARQQTQALVTAMSEPRRERVVVGSRGFDVVLEPDLEAGGWVVECPSLPGCVSEGDTLRGARAMIRDAIRTWLQADEAATVPAAARRRVAR